MITISMNAITRINMLGFLHNFWKVLCCAPGGTMIEKN